MQITKVRIKLIPDKARLKAIASITLDNELVINDIKVIQTGKRLCAEFPKHQFAKNNNLEYIVPLNQVTDMMEVRSFTLMVSGATALAGLFKWTLNIIENM